MKKNVKCTKNNLPKPLKNGQKNEKTKKWKNG